MKRILLTSLIVAGVLYATEANTPVEYEHALKSASSVESVAEDMSEMKAMGKCGADQKAHKKIPTSHKDGNGSALPVEYEHALKSASSDEAIAEDMSKMKAMGKCGADQKMSKHAVSKTNETASVPVEYEHALKSASSDEAVAEDMSKMKAMGKCGSGN